MAEQNDNLPNVTDDLKPEKADADALYKAKATEQGWVPEDQWTGAPEDWRPAKEFVDRGELFKKIDEGKREIRQLKQAFEEFGRHHERVRQLEYERALNDLKAQKKEALANDDHDAVVEIDEAIAEKKEERKAQQARPVVSNEPDPVFVTWLNKNQWYSSDEDMKDVADTAGRKAAMQGVTDKREILSAVEAAVRRVFPHKFKNPNQERAGAVEGSTNKVANKKDDSFEAGLSAMEKRMMDTIIKSTGMSREKYIEEYKAVEKRKSRGA